MLKSARTVVANRFATRSAVRVPFAMPIPVNVSVLPEAAHHSVEAAFIATVGEVFADGVQLREDAHRPVPEVAVAAGDVALPVVPDARPHAPPTKNVIPAPGTDACPPFQRRDPSEEKLSQSTVLVQTPPSTSTVVAETTSK